MNTKFYGLIDMKTCPKCKSNMIIDIVYGYPSEEIFEDADRNKIALGGCCIDSSNPIFKCKSCWHEFGGQFKEKLTFTEMEKQETPMRYYLKKYYVKLKIIILVPPAVLYLKIKSILKREL